MADTSEKPQSGLIRRTGKWSPVVTLTLTEAVQRMAGTSGSGGAFESINSHVNTAAFGSLSLQLLFVAGKGLADAWKRGVLIDFRVRFGGGDKAPDSGPALQPSVTPSVVSEGATQSTADSLAMSMPSTALLAGAASGVGTPAAVLQQEERGSL
ncbi:hypothetical protein ABZX90_03795 [Streptomyces sp. NPDC002935]|uniref:hypothetical protein n=1 Tax=Streptomyces sp. NPDC002935 TaxID=3154545 RepID=UPI0033A87E04